MKLIKWILSLGSNVGVKFSRGGRNYRKFTKETSNDNWRDSMDKARLELEEALVKVDKRKKLSREINYKVKNGIPLTTEEEKFIGVIRID